MDLSQHPAGLAKIDRVEARAYKIPTDAPESDGTYARDSTTLIIAEATGMGYTYSYSDASTVPLINGLLAGSVRGEDASAVPLAWAAMVAAIRNVGRPGVASAAISAVDAAPWDLKGKLLGLPVATRLS